MGKVDNICISKTGILTQNTTALTDCFIEEKTKNINDLEGISENTMKHFCIGICNNSNANPVFIENDGKYQGM